MDKRLAMAATVGSAIGLLFAARASAQTQAGMKTEVDFLLGSIVYSGCEFYRNGSCHSGAAAQAHLRLKYDVLLARRQLTTTEQFIDLVATKSSFSGQAYRVRCEKVADTSSRQWMHEQLARDRASR